MQINKKLEFKSSIFEVEDIPKNSKARGWSSLRVGDIVQFSIEPNNYSYYSSLIWVTKLNDTTARWDNSQALFYANVAKFKFKEIQSCP